MKKLLARLWLALTGWSVEVTRPQTDHFVLLAAPHTTNWDLPYMLAAAWSADISPAWIGKHTLFGPWTGWLFRFLGGIPVDRTHRSDAVQQVIRIFAERRALHLTIAAEGTRRRTEHWKSGFYWMAHGAGVPIAFGFLDYARKVAGIGPTLETSGDPEKDMDEIRSFYQDIEGRHPAGFGPIRLREETERATHRG